MHSMMGKIKLSALYHMFHAHLQHQNCWALHSAIISWHHEKSANVLHCLRVDCVYVLSSRFSQSVFAQLANSFTFHRCFQNHHEFANYDKHNNHFQSQSCSHKWQSLSRNCKLFHEPNPWIKYCMDRGSEMHSALCCLLHGTASLFCLPWFQSECPPLRQASQIQKQQQ